MIKSWLFFRPRLTQQCCGLVDLRLGHTGVTEHQRRLGRLNRWGVISGQTVHPHADGRSPLHQLTFQHAVSHVQQQVQTRFRAGHLMRQVGQFTCKRRQQRVAPRLIYLAAAADVPLKGAGAQKGRKRVLLEARHGG